MNAKLTNRQVSALRRSDKPDEYHARKFKVARLTILRARIGHTFKNVKAPPRFRLDNT